jgi:hypothetical protein
VGYHIRCSVDEPGFAMRQDTARDPDPREIRRLSSSRRLR